MAHKCIAQNSIVFRDIYLQCEIAPDYLCMKFKKRSSVHDRSTRNNNKLRIPLYRTFSGQRLFTHRAVCFSMELF